jgi:hypothetical protein
MLCNAWPATDTHTKFPFGSITRRIFPTYRSVPGERRNEPGFPSIECKLRNRDRLYGHRQRLFGIGSFDFVDTRFLKQELL